MYLISKNKRKLIIVTILFFLFIGGTYLFSSLLNNNETNIIAAKVMENSEVELKQSISSNEIILSINDIDIDYETYKYYLNNEKLSIDNNDDSYWEDQEELSKTKKDLASSSKISKEELEKNVIYKLQNLVALKELQKKYNIKISKEEIEKEYDSIEELYGKENLEDMLNEIEVTKDFYKSIIEDTLLEEKLFKKLFSIEILEKMDKTKVTGYKRLLITFEDTTSNLKKNSVVEKQDNGIGIVRKLTQSEAKTLIDQIYEKLENGEDFQELIKKYGEDPLFVDGNIDYVKYGDLSEIENNYLFTLSNNEYSNPFISEYGYEILYRLEASDEYIEDNLMYFANDEMWTRYNKIISDMVEEQTIKIKENYIYAFSNQFN